ncbi:MAG: hypothetical protein V7731_07070 [Amphritea sp.]
MLAQAAVQPSVTVQESTQTPSVCMVLKQVKPMMRETVKPEVKAEQPHYDFVGIAG